MNTGLDLLGSTDARVRASNAEREEVATILRSAAAEGMLTLEEVDERLASAYAATYRSDLAPLTWDLPGHGRPLAESTPKARAEARSGLFRHGRFVLVVAAVLIGLWALSGANFFWPIWPLAFLGWGLYRHARRARGLGSERWGRGFRRWPSRY